MSAAELRRGLALSLALTTLVALLTLVLDGTHAALVMTAVGVPAGALTVLATRVALGRRPAAPSLGRQLSSVALIALGQLLVVLGLFVGLMFVTSTQALLTALVAVDASILAVWVARVLARRILGDLDRLGAALDDIGAGRRELHIGQLASHELTGLGQAVSVMAARLGAEERAREAAQSAHRDLLAAVSHDLRTPITALRLLSEALQDDVVEPTARAEYLRRIGVHVRALGGLIDDLFELSRLQAGELRWTMEQVAVDVLVQETVDAMRPEADLRSVHMHTELPSRAPDARGNPEQIQRVLFNLIQNAIRHTPSDGSIRVRAVALPSSVHIEVADSGRGIPRDERERVFLPFVQGAEHAARSGDGAGLGLAISRAIVEAHGGRIWLADAAVGTRVRFSLPRAPAA